ncbi:ABC transporter permease [Gluconacetobacter azotocaptans]|uniref:MlaE family ABC transporter permease n=1 Tax=Gluconacetobacter azotocaptans TaxID=142834 RepID=UPI00195D6363|nr:ABC transporter permease [Gluconacetobacter azotocaptans]MBM9401149.1 ABC transporter permease [Gluconacetobacter azotocaptans]
MQGERNMAPAWELQGDDLGAILEMKGSWVAGLSTTTSFPKETLSRIYDGRTGARICVDAAGLSKWDSTFIAFLWAVKQASAEMHMTFDVSRLPDSARRLFALLPEDAIPHVPSAVHHFSPLQDTGRDTIEAFREIGALSELGVETTKGAIATAGGRGSMRLRDLFVNIYSAGPSALIIVSVVNFLVGAILAFVGSVQLHKFSADIYVANLVGIACVRELAAVMTAIIMAGRTGGAYAARIATMLGNEEIDALRVFGVPISGYILLPSVLGLMVMMPLLYLYGCGMSIIGGYVVATLMLPDLTGSGYLNQVVSAVDIRQFDFGFVKSIVFAVMIGLTACQIGLNAGRSAADVGTAATRAVVVGIVGVIALDAVFAVIANALNI